MATATRSRSLQECSSLLIRSRRWHTGRSRGPPAQAEQWASEFEHLPDHRSEITRVWLASKLRMDAFPRTERLIYERTLKRDLDFASQWHAPQPPSSKVVAFASCVAVLGLAGPVYVLLVYATALGQAQSWPFLLNFFFEFMLVYFLIVPLMILFNKIFLPSLLDERLQQDAFEDDEGFGGASPGAPLTPSDAAPVPELDLDRVDGVEQRIVRMRSYPYKTPLNETPLDFLVAREPELKALVDEARRSRGHGHALALAVDPRLSLEALEQIHDQEHWNPSWSAWLMLNVLGVFLLLPDTMQDIVMEELLLILPAATYLVNEGVLRSTDGRCTGSALSSFVAFASMACLFGVGFRVDGVFVGYRSRFAETRRRGRNSRLDNGWFLIAFTLVFGHACALLVTALVSKAQARAAARHEKKRSRVRRRAATLVAEEAASPRTRPRGSVVDGLDDVADSEEARTELASALARAKAEDDSASDFSS